MWPDNGVTSVLIASMLLVLVKGSSISDEAQGNFTVGSSSSPWLKKATNHWHPRDPGCWRTPWICRRQGKQWPMVRMQCCNNQCVDVSSDVNHCGGCGIRCRFSEQCCDGFCVDINTSPFNCGRCGNRCPWGVECVYAMCGYGGGGGSEPPPPGPFPFPPPWPRPPFPFPPPWPRPPFPFPPRPWPHPPFPQPPRPWPFHPPRPPMDHQLPSVSESS